MSVPVQFPGFRKNEPTAAGRAIVTAADAEAQRSLLDVYSQSEIVVLIGNIELPTRDSLGLDIDDSPTFAGIFSSGSVRAQMFQFTGSSTSTKITNSGNNLSFDVSDSPFVQIGVFSGIIGVRVAANHMVGWVNGPYMYRGGNGILSLRNGTEGQVSRVHKTYESGTSGEWIEQDAASEAGFFRIDACIGSTGGSTRGIKIGTKSGAGTPTDWIVCNTDGTTIIKPPTSDPGIAGALWNDAGTLKISAG